MSTRSYAASAAGEETTDDLVRTAALRFRKYIKTLAHRLSDGDCDLAKDLEQEALIVLWTEDPTRFEAGDEWYLRAAMRKRMLAVVRREQRVSLSGRRISIYARVA